MSNLRGAVQRRMGGTWGTAPCLQLPTGQTGDSRNAQCLLLQTFGAVRALLG